MVLRALGRGRRDLTGKEGGGRKKVNTGATEKRNAGE